MNHFLFELHKLSNAAADGFWIGREAVVALHRRENLSLPQTVKLKISTGQSQLYQHYPFTSWLQAEDGTDLEILEFTGPHQDRFIQIRLHENLLSKRIIFQTECGACPSLIGLSEDKRELSLLVTPVCLESGSPETCLGLAADPARQRLVVNQRRRRRKGAATDRHLRKFASDIQPVPRPTFVLGSYRSGTSALTWAIGQHPDIFSLEETSWLPHVAFAAQTAHKSAEFAARSANDIYDVSVREISRALAQAMHALIINNCRMLSLGGCALSTEAPTAPLPRTQVVGSRFAPKRQWVDGSPENANYAHILSEFYPEARFVGVLRDPVQVIESLLHFEALSGRKYGVEGAARIWETLTRATVEAALALGPDRMIVFPFDSVIDHPEACLDEIWELIDQPRFAPAARVFEQRINSSYGADKSGPKTETEIGSEHRHLIAGKDKIFKGLLAGTPVSALPWSQPLSPWGAASNDVISQILKIYRPIQTDP